MEKVLKIKKEENLHDWCKRVALFHTISDEEYEKWFDILREVSVESYIRGVNANK